MARKRGRPEEALQANVKKLGELLGWKYYHPYRSTRSVRGYLDVELVRPPRLIKSELKSATGRVSDDQHEWIRTYLRICEISVYLWRPDDWIRGRIERALKQHVRAFDDSQHAWTLKDSGYEKCDCCGLIRQ